MFPVSCLRTQNSALSTSAASPASQLLQAAIAAARSPFPLPIPLSKSLGISDDTLVPITDFTPDGQFPISESLSTQNSALRTGSALPTSTLNSPDAPITALIPRVSTRGVDTNPSKLISSNPNASTAIPKSQRGESAIAQAEGSAQAWVEASLTLSPEGAIQSNTTASSECETEVTLKNLLASESTLAQRLTTLDPLAPTFMQTLHTLATLRYYITAKRADLAAAQNPTYLNALAKATAIVQRDHHRLAREAAAKDREHNRRQREERQDARYKQRQQDAELKYKRKLHLAELALQREARADQRRKRAAEARDYRENYKTKYMEPNPHNQPKTPKAPISLHAEPSTQHLGPAAPSVRDSAPLYTGTPARK